ncbi:MAG: hypothetical protein M2R45_04910 [Verrucomicrobia subdivision 3 bacterium]|nr:hypothetical protein [Limisphaerales bacterium]MCS1417562.1 hypothetical protein [Limisphaerales bacterium]
MIKRYGTDEQSETEYDYDFQGNQTEVRRTGGLDHPL